MLLPVLVAAALASAPAPSPVQVIATVPVWTQTVKLPPPDGRTLVTDGRLALDVAVAKPAVRPSASLPPDAAKAFASYLAASYPTEFGLDDLREGKTQTLFVGPGDLGLATHYVLFLRRNLPKIRFRSKGANDPVIIVLDGRPVGLVMPMVMPH
jgi:hypothetical protein